MKEPLTIALIYDFDGTLAPGNMQEYDFIPAVGKSNKEFWHDANQLAEEQDADMVLTYMARMIQEALRLLFEQIKAPGTPYSKVVVPTDFVVGKTTRP